MPLDRTARPGPPRRPRPGRPRRAGLALTDVLAAMAGAAVLLALALPATARLRGDADVLVSLDNLRVLGLADASYAADWNGRQWTAIVDSLGAWGANVFTGFTAYNEQAAEDHPPVTLGWGPLEPGGPIVFYAYRTGNNLANASLCQPINFSSSGATAFFGSFRFVNDARFTPYVGGRFYDEPYYAPTDPVVWPVVEPLLGEPYQYVDAPTNPGIGSIPYWSSYALSAAAMFDPAVMAARTAGPGGPQGGWTDPWSLDLGFRSPALSQARHPSLKTRLLEHHWLQGDPPADPCNPGFGGGTYPDPDDPGTFCEPWYFNHGLASAPATLFYDGSTRVLPNTEVLVADEIVQEQSGGVDFDGLWSRTTPFGQDGYFNELAFEPVGLSHHVLTADGILGRDTLEPAALDGRDAASIVRRRAARSTSAVAPAPAPWERVRTWAHGLLDAGPHRQ